MWLLQLVFCLACGYLIFGYMTVQKMLDFPESFFSLPWWMWIVCAFVGVGTFLNTVRPD